MFLSLEAEIMGRLRAQVPPAVTVAAGPDAPDSVPRTPAVYVVFDGYSVAEHAANGQAARVRQTWLAVVAVRNLAEAQRMQPARAEADGYADAVIQALLGWKPPGASQPFRLAEAPKPQGSAGTFYLPLAFQTELVFKGDTA